MQADTEERVSLRPEAQPYLSRSASLVDALIRRFRGDDVISEVRNETLVGSLENGNESSPFGRRRVDTIFMNLDGVALLAYMRLSANVSSAIGERPVRRASCPNMLVVGAFTDVEATLLALVSEAPTTIHEWTLDVPIPSCDRPGIVIIRDVDRMPFTLQNDWLSWLTD